ncbi:hypothetical protein OG462_08550 [Streptomyces sp. NBC_01077]|uniref:hypothetical protein n=1 Tax=Streptomyces sp. NBC_01077 TaxID=2903746 RepID=UPI00386AE262|nr:hypothetical protein OG462_08550 [Streptomyces sp. NBC_01077]
MTRLLHPSEPTEETPSLPEQAATATDEDGKAAGATDGRAATDEDGNAAEATDGRAATDEDGNAAEATDGDGKAATDEGGGRSPAGWRKAAVAAAVTLLLLGGSAFFHGAHQLRSTPSARNHALTDAGATTRVGGDVGEGLARIFSYTPASTDGAERSAGTVLAGRAARQYSDLFAQVRAKLVEQRITLTTQAVRTGVIELDGDSARLLVFLDQTSRRDSPRQDKATATSAAAQLTVTARFQGDRWLIVDIKAR